MVRQLLHILPRNHLLNRSSVTISLCFLAVISLSLRYNSFTSFCILSLAYYLQNFLYYGGARFVIHKIIFIINCMEQVWIFWSFHKLTFTITIVPGKTMMEPDVGFINTCPSVLQYHTSCINFLQHTRVPPLKMREAYSIKLTLSVFLSTLLCNAITQKVCNQAYRGQRREDFGNKCQG